MRRLLAVTALLVLACAAPAGADIDLGSTAHPQAIAIGDFDSDGRQDLLIAAWACQCVHVRLGNGDGTFRSRGDGVVTGAAVMAEDLAVADYNGDGDEDMVVAAQVSGGGWLARARGAGDGTLAVDRPYDSGARAHSVATGDFDNDGWSDIAAAAGEQVFTERGIGGGAGGSLGIPLGAPVRSVATADFNGDGSGDVVVLVNAAQPGLIVLPGKGDGQFGPGHVLLVPNPGAALAVGDFDADGRHDVVVPVPARDRLIVRLGNGDGTLRGGAPDVAVGSAPQAVAVADIDADGREDLVAANSGSDNVSVRLGNGDGTFRDGGTIAAGDEPVDVAVGDFDADGRQDLAIANQDSGTVSVRLGAGQGELAGNLLVNGGFEQGLGARIPQEAPLVPGWTSVGGITFMRYGGHPHIGVPSRLDAARHGGGRHFLWGGDSLGFGGVTEVSQTVAVTPEAELRLSAVVEDPAGSRRIVRRRVSVRRVS